MTEVDYGEGVPRTLRDACDRMADRIVTVYREPGIASPSGFGYSITTAYGWCFDPGHHREIADTVRDGLHALRQVQRCPCLECADALEP